MLDGAAGWDRTSALPLTKGERTLGFLRLTASPPRFPPGLAHILCWHQNPLEPPPRRWAVAVFPSAKAAIDAGNKDGGCGDLRPAHAVASQSRANPRRYL